MAKKVVIFTDGACRGNPGAGGWAAILRFGDNEKILSGSEIHTTNNRMELRAAIAALSALRRACTVEIYTDSQYLQYGMQTWLAKWKAKNWRNSARKSVKNRDLWEQIDQLSNRHNITWHWVKGHAGHVDNERADQLANQAIDKIQA